MKKDTIIVVLGIISQGLSWLAEFLSRRRKARKK